MNDHRSADDFDGDVMKHATKIAVFVLLAAAVVRAGDLTVQLLPGMKPASATATATGVDLAIDGTIKDGMITFQKLLPATPYDVKVTLADGTILQGVDLSWYNEDPPKPKAGKFTEDDRKEVQAIMDVPSFYNKNEILLLNANHDRAVVLAQLIRDSAFHSDKGDEVIWRIELWYFKNEYGGWAKINQVNKILRRERYATRAEYESAVSKIKWTPQLGGISVPKGGTLTVQLTPPKPPATQSAGDDGDGPDADK
jgi:hypothetical protein